VIEPDSLNIWSEDRLVGYLWRDQASPAGVGFRYDEDWIENGFSISRTLPLSTAEYAAEPGGTVQRFFANLLPESGARGRIVRDLKIPDTDFDLLRAIGGECAGALTVLPLEQTPSEQQHYSRLTHDQLHNLVARRGPAYGGIKTNDRPRLSLAGAQDKCPVLIRNNQYFLPLKEAPSSHILKFEIPDYKNIPAYETFTTLLARHSGLPTIGIQLCTVNSRFFVCIERYDRIWDAQENLGRLHQEDFCQALGYGHQNKYQEYGGPSFADCYRLVQNASTDPAIDPQLLLRWQIFNVLAGNSDGHAKNLSFLYTPDRQIRLAPFYDLVCTRAIERIDQQLAFDVGGERNPGIISQTHWRAEANACGIRPGFLLGLVKNTAQRLQDKLVAARAEFNSQYGSYPALQRVEQVVRKQCARAIDRGE